MRIAIADLQSKVKQLQNEVLLAQVESLKQKGSELRCSRLGQGDVGNANTRMKCKTRRSLPLPDQKESSNQSL